MKNQDVRFKLFERYWNEQRQIVKNLYDGSSWFFSPRLFQNVWNSQFPNFWKFPNRISKHDFAWIVWSDLVYSKLKSNWFPEGLLPQIGPWRENKAISLDCSANWSFFQFNNAVNWANSYSKVVIEIISVNTCHFLICGVFASYLTTLPRLFYAELLQQI